MAAGRGPCREGRRQRTAKGYGCCNRLPSRLSIGLFLFVLLLLNSEQIIQRGRNGTAAAYVHYDRRQGRGLSLFSLLSTVVVHRRVGSVIKAGDDGATATWEY